MCGFCPKLTCLDVPAERSADRALFIDGKVISHGELYLRSRTMAANLERLGVDASGPLALVARSSSLFAWMVYAARLYGVALIPLSSAMDSQRCNRLLQDAGCTQLITEEQLPDMLPGIRVIAAAKLLDCVESMVMGRPGVERKSDEIQLIVATSGSEGDPKGVMLSGRNLAASALAVRKRLGLEQGNIWLCCLPLYHIGGLSILYRCLDAGAEVLLHQGFDAQIVWSDLQGHQVTHLSLVPAMLVQLLDAAQSVAPPETLRVVLVGGGPLDPELAARARAQGWPLFVSYGMSETASLCVSHAGESSGPVSGEVGRPLDGFELAISKRGRIMLRGPAVMQGYANPDGSPGQGLLDGGWFETGDLGELGESGHLRVLGRADDVLVSGGRNIHPVEVEAEIAACPGVDAVAITGQKDDHWGQILVALYTGSVTARELDEWCHSNIPSGLRPRRYVQVVALPRNAMGKLDRKGLRELLDQV